MRIKLSKRGLFDERWAWTETEINNVLKCIIDCKKPILHICSGSSGIGDIRFDRVKVDYKNLHGMPKTSGCANVLGSILNLPFKDSSVNTVLCDPPYDYRWFEIGIYQEMINEIVRVTKVSGKVVFYAPSVFTHPTLELIKTEFSRMGKRCYFKILSTSIKKNGQISDWNYEVIK